jgi:hypothetical protein
VDLLYALQTLRRRWIWAVLGLIPAAYIALASAYHVSLAPPALHKKNIEFGAASTQLLIDSPQSSLADVTGDLAPLATRAAVFTQFLQSDPVKAEIGKRLGISPRAIVVTAPGASPGVTAATGGQAAQQRNQGLLSESKAFQLLVIGQQNVPVITLYAQGPTARAAGALADAAAAGLAAYVGRLQSQERISPLSRIAIRQLGQAQGAMVNSGASRTIAGLTFLGLTVLVCILVILGGGLFEKWRMRDEFEAASVAVAPAPK